MTTSKIAIMAACLLAASGLAWAALPASEAGEYGEWTAVKEDGGELGVSGKGAVAAAPVVGTMTMYVEDGGRDGGRSGAGGGVGWGAGTGGLTDAAPAGGGDVVAGVDGPEGSAQGWCKEGLEARTNANTGDMVCVPYGYRTGMTARGGSSRGPGRSAARAAVMRVRAAAMAGTAGMVWTWTERQGSHGSGCRPRRHTWLPGMSRQAHTSLG